ncbi:hypothetical protein FBU31_006135, partial [Coemansia sp. 'formosensis']
MQQQHLPKTTTITAVVILQPQSSVPESPESPHLQLQALDNPGSNNSIKSVACPPAHVAAAADDLLLSSTSAMPSQPRLSCSISSSSSASTCPLPWDHRPGKRALVRPNSVFYRPRRRSITPPLVADDNDSLTSLNDADMDSACEPEPTTIGATDKECDNEVLEL